MEEFFSGALFGKLWQNAARAILLPLVCFVVFKLGGGFISLVVIVAFGGTDINENHSPMALAIA